MTNEEKLIEALAFNMGNESNPALLQGIVQAAGDTSCDVLLTNSEDLVITDVQYTATVDNTEGFVIKPQEGTNVIIGIIGNDINTAYVVSMDAIDSVSLKVNDIELLMDADGKISWGNGQVSLRDIFTGIFDMVKQITINTTSGTPLPPTILAIEQLEIDVQSLFK